MDFTKLDSLRDRVATMRPLSDGEIARLRDEFVIENTYNSNAIEGNSLTLRETALVLREGITIAEKPLADHLEAVGHRDAFEFVFSITNETALSERVIKEIHSLVLMNDARNRGTYRRLPVVITGARHTPPEPFSVPELMAQLIEDYETMKREMHIVEAIAEFHLRFEGIHPFIDGNGRVGRLILNLELIRAGLLPVDIKFTDRRKYYDCFDAYYGDEHTAEPLVRMIADYETERLVWYLEALGGIHE